MIKYRFNWLIFLCLPFSWVEILVGFKVSHLTVFIVLISLFFSRMGGLLHFLKSEYGVLITYFWTCIFIFYMSFLSESFLDFYALKFSAYFFCSIVLFLFISTLSYMERDLFCRIGSRLIGASFFCVGLFWLVDTDGRVFMVILDAILQGNPTGITHNLFGIHGMVSNLYGIQILGGRHTLAETAFLGLCLVGLGRKRGIIDFCCLGMFLVVIFLMQSRSIWLCCALLAFIGLLFSSRLSVRALVWSVAVSIALGMALGGFISERLLDMSSYSYRLDALTDGWSLMLSRDFFDTVGYLESNPHNIFWYVGLLSGFGLLSLVVIFYGQWCAYMFRLFLQNNYWGCGLIICFIIRSVSGGENLASISSFVGLGIAAGLSISTSTMRCRSSQG